MKLYKTDLVALKVTSCKVCPNRRQQEADIPSGIPGGMVCIAITREFKCDPWETYFSHPPISEAKHFGGFLPDCPLKDV